MHVQIPDEAKRLVNDIRGNKGILAVYLFGSVATGKVNKNSDIDICVIPVKEKHGMDLVVRLSAKAAPKLDIVAFHRLPIQIRYRVFRDGIPLYEKDQTDVSRVIYNTIHDYLDMKPALDRMYERILKRRRKHG